VLKRCTNIDSLQQWLRRRGTAVLGIDFTDSPGVIATLPCPMLQALILDNSSVDLRPGSQLLRDFCSARALTRLVFLDVTLSGEPDLAAVLLALPNLQVFCLSSTLHQQYLKVQQSPLQQQQQLHDSTVSDVQDSHEPSQQLWSAHGDTQDGGKCFTDSGMQVLFSLTQLVELQLCSLQGVSTACLEGLHHMRRLEVLSLMDLTCEVGLDAVPAFSQLTALTALVLCWMHDTPAGGFEPSALVHMTQLQGLRLIACTPARGKAGAAELLSRLSQMPKLQELVLEGIAGLEECPPEAFHALTSSSMLKKLVLTTSPPHW